MQKPATALDKLDAYSVQVSRIFTTLDAEEVEKGLFIRLGRLLDDSSSEVRLPHTRPKALMIRFANQVFYVVEPGKKLLEDIAQAILNAQYQIYDWVRIEAETLVISGLTGASTGRQIEMVEGRCENFTLCADLVDLTEMSRNLNGGDMTNPPPPPPDYCQIVDASLEGIKDMTVDNFLQADSPEQLRAFFRDVEMDYLYVPAVPQAADAAIGVRMLSSEDVREHHRFESFHILVDGQPVDRTFWIFQGVLDVLTTNGYRGRDLRFATIDNQSARSKAGMIEFRRV